MSNIHHLGTQPAKTAPDTRWRGMACAGKTCAGRGWTPSRYLLTLCNEELLWRESEKLRRYKKEARLPVAKTTG